MSQKSQFARRLIASLKRAGIDPASPTRVAIAFNLQHRGQPVSTQAVHKWLSGAAIPSQDKLVTCARWLGVTPEWLRFGEPTRNAPDSAPTAKQDIAEFRVTDQSLPEAFSRLSDQHRMIVRDLVSTLLRIEDTGK